MKFAVAVLMIACMLGGCSTTDHQLDQAMELRKTILTAESCTFGAVITADYGDKLYSFQMDCSADTSGNLSFTVTAPDTISGITGMISQEGAALTFDDKVLAFPMLADNQLSPVSAPWVFLSTLRSGYITGCSREDDTTCIYIDDSFEENPLYLEIYTDKDMNPIRAEIFWNQRRILSADILDFAVQ